MAKKKKPQSALYDWAQEDARIKVEAAERERIYTQEPLTRETLIQFLEEECSLEVSCYPGWSGYQVKVSLLYQNETILAGNTSLPRVKDMMD